MHQTAQSDNKTQGQEVKYLVWNVCIAVNFDAIRTQLNKQEKYKKHNNKVCTEQISWISAALAFGVFGFTTVGRLCLGSAFV